MKPLTNDQIITAALNMIQSSCKTAQRIGKLILNTPEANFKTHERIDKLINDYL